MPVFRFPQHACVLIHIPKTGGTSIRQGFFEGQYEGPVQGHIPDAWLSDFKFAFVRNPFDRLISAWQMFASGMRQDDDSYLPAAGNFTLREFLDIVMDESIPFDGRRRERLEVRIRHHSLPMTHPFYCLDQADQIGRYEILAQDFKLILNRLGLDGELPHFNQTKRQPYQVYFDEETRRLAEQFYREDLERFGYRFEPLPSPATATRGSSTATIKGTMTTSSPSDSDGVRNLPDQSTPFDARSWFAGIEKQTIDCPLCESNDLARVSEQDRYRMNLTTSGCRNCGMIFVNPQPIESAVQEFYEKHYRQLYESVDQPSPEYVQQGPFIPRARFVVRSLAPLIERYQVQTMLDIGCAEGTLLKMMKQRFPQLSCHGIEPNEPFAEYARRSSGASSVSSSSFQEFFDTSNQQFDLITLTHVLEHFARPVEMLQKIRSKLTRHGLLYVEVPNVMHPQSVGIGQLHLAHLMYFHPGSLRNAMQAAGFHLIELLEDGLPAKTKSMAAIGTLGPSKPIQPCGPGTAEELFDDFRNRIHARRHRASADS